MDIKKYIFRWFFGLVKMAFYGVLGLLSCNLKVRSEDLLISYLKILRNFL